MESILAQTPMLSGYIPDKPMFISATLGTDVTDSSLVFSISTSGDYGLTSAYIYQIQYIELYYQNPSDSVYMKNGSSAYMFIPTVPMIWVWYSDYYSNWAHTWFMRRFKSQNTMPSRKTHSDAFHPLTNFTENTFIDDGYAMFHVQSVSYTSDKRCSTFIYTGITTITEKPHLSISAIRYKKA